MKIQLLSLLNAPAMEALFAVADEEVVENTERLGYKGKITVARDEKTPRAYTGGDEILDFAILIDKVEMDDPEAEHNFRNLVVFLGDQKNGRYAPSVVLEISGDENRAGGSLDEVLTWAREVSERMNGVTFTYTLFQEFCALAQASVYNLQFLGTDEEKEDLTEGEMEARALLIFPPEEANVYSAPGESVQSAPQSNPAAPLDASRPAGVTLH